MLGKILIYITFLASILSVVFYFLSHKYNPKIKYIARGFYYAVFFGSIATSLFLLYILLTHNFQYFYVWSYSSKELPTYLLISSFFAGQEGSFLLWALFTAIIGTILIPYLNKRDYESLSMGFYSLILVFFYFLLIIKSPFNYIWDSMPEHNLEYGFTPLNGRGLNPILENFWMSIHPPILFIGYACLSVPFIIGLTGLIKKDFDNWILAAIPWNLFSVATLGLGIALGAFWSYETLGWGGYWAWDPVENSSLLPWITSVALSHTFLNQKHKDRKSVV